MVTWGSDSGLFVSLVSLDGLGFKYLLMSSIFSPEPASLKFSKNIGCAAYVSCRLEL